VIATSLSIGIAIFPEHGSTAQTVLAVADEAMYRAKNTQRGSYQLALQDQMNKENQS
jgi:GGDEF domain-containing protein